MPSYTSPNRRHSLGKPLDWIVGLACVLAGLTARADDIDFQRQIRPIFEKHCYRCHGANKQEGGLRLDVRASGLKGGDNYAPAIKPQHSAESPLFQFVARDDADLRMPPKGEGLTKSEVELVRRWIDAGAAWPDDPATAASRTSKHWSFQSIRRPVVPAPPVTPPILSVSLERSPIDAFVEAQLRGSNLSFSQIADRRTLIRRLYLVLLGLPPTSDEVESFVTDADGRAWPGLVERVLANPRYGERWAQHWLDLVRFGETNGYETNRERPTAWHYRDYVIDALNRDKPYDDFVREQIAGDSLASDVATGFLVAGPYDLVKSQDINLTLMQRQDELADIINTTGTAILGLTLGCARCHNHKFDPITQRDFYAFQAVFAGVQHGERPLPPSPQRAERLAELDRRVLRLSQELAQFIPLAATPARPALREAVQARKNVERIRPAAARLVRFTVLATNSSEPCLDELEVYAAGKNVALASLGTKARCSSALPGYEIHKLEHINDGRHGNGRSWISNEPGAGWIELELPMTEMIERIEWGRDREGQFRDRVATKYRIECATEPGRWQTVASSDDRLPPTDLATTAAAGPTYRFDDAPPDLAARGRQWLNELEAAKRERAQLATSSNAYVGTFQPPPVTRRLFRGDPLAPREDVAPDTIAALGALDLAADAAERDRRNALARWLTRTENPLTARVWVNRIWQFQFGRGLVDTPNDFGANGVPPSHPELLDWLADELIQSGWSTKHIQRLILLSHTWQQDNRPTREGLAADASCQLLWRFPPRRLEAESIRDSILAATGALDLRAGGPGFDGFDVQLENVRHYFPKSSYGPADWRRMVYMTKVRMEKDAVFGVFDCPDASQIVARRSQSTTPLQALNLLNSPFIQQQANLLTERLQREAGDDPASQARRAFVLCCGRPAERDEQAAAAAFIASHGLAQFCRAMLNSNEMLFVP